MTMASHHTWKREVHRDLCTKVSAFRVSCQEGRHHMDAFQHGLICTKNINPQGPRQVWKNEML